jgi:hypothetical protein
VFQQPRRTTPRSDRNTIGEVAASLVLKSEYALASGYAATLQQIRFLL